MSEPRPESARAMEAYHIYESLGPNRSIDAVAQRLNKSRTLIGRWSGMWGWAERVRAHDKKTEDIRRAAADRAAADFAYLWERRRYEALENTYKDAQTIRAKVREMFATAIDVEVVEDGRVTRKPARWNFGIAARMLRDAVEAEQSAIKAAGPDIDEYTHESVFKGIKEATRDCRVGGDREGAAPSADGHRG